VGGTVENHPATVEKPYLSGFYETAVESNAIPVCFSLLGVFAFGLFLLE